jgi:hypothetical protein
MGFLARSLTTLLRLPFPVASQVPACPLVLASGVRLRRANWKHGHFSREAKAERSRLRAAMLAVRDLCASI